MLCCFESHVQRFPVASIKKKRPVIYKLTLDPGTQWHHYLNVRQAVKYEQRDNQTGWRQQFTSNWRSLMHIKCHKWSWACGMFAAHAVLSGSPLFTSLIANVFLRWGFSLCDEWNNMGRSTGLGLYSQAAAVKKGSGWWDRPLGNPSHTLTACRDRTYWHVLRCEWMDSKVCLGVCVLGWGQWGVDHQYPGTTDMSRAIALKTCEKETAVIFILTVPFTEIQD